jgi:ABC-type transport system involved in multi-copper enzyme maturation permease subunit
VNPASQTLLLAREALRDAFRERIGLGVIVLAFLLSLLVDRCSGVHAGIVINGRMLDAALLARVSGPVLFASISLLLSAGTGLVACDLLARPLEQGVATLWLARPVGRGIYALSRLAGALGLGLAAALLVLGGATALLAARHGLSPLPGLVGLVVHALDAAIVATIAMTLSLLLPRLLAFFAVLAWLQIVALANVFHMLGIGVGGWFGAIDHWGPPIGTALLYAVGPWVGLTPTSPEMLAVGLRLLVWLAGGIALLVWSVRRIEPR